MRKLILLVLLCSGVVFAQDAPSSYTTNFNLRKYDSGDKPGADSLNAQWDEIDSAIAYLANSQISAGSSLSWIGLTSASSQSSSISATNLTSPTTTATGLYRVNVHLEADDVPGQADSARVIITWLEDGGASVSDSTSTIVLSAETAYTSKQFFFYHLGAGATAVKYSTYYASGGGGTDTYAFRIIVERLN